MKWYTPEENMPPYEKLVCIEAELRFGYHMHMSAWFDVTGWHLLKNDIKEYKVVKWRFYDEGKRTEQA